MSVDISLNITNMSKHNKKVVKKVVLVSSESESTDSDVYESENSEIENSDSDVCESTNSDSAVRDSDNDSEPANSDSDVDESENDTESANSDPDVDESENDSESADGSNSENDISASGDESDNDESSDNANHHIKLIKNNAHTVIFNDNKLVIDVIYHGADFHIPTNKRHDEFENVLQETHDQIRDDILENGHNALITIVGDIFHEKCISSPEVDKLVVTHIAALGKLAPVIIIAGNHDCNVKNKEQLDKLHTFFVYGKKMDNMHYLYKNGAYQYANIVFGVTDVRDDNVFTVDKINTKLFPNNKHKKMHKIALYHGSIYKSETCTGYKLSKRGTIPKAMFDGYDFVMLGDIHKHQYFGENMAYPGSLVQQNFGESLDNHGILKWELAKKTSTLIEIPNDYGFCTVRIVDGVPKNNFEKHQVPKYPRFRFFSFNTPTSKSKEIINDYKNTYDFCEHIHIQKERFDKSMPGMKLDGNEDILHATMTSTKFQTEQITKYLTSLGTCDDEIRNVVALHKSVSDELSSSSLKNGKTGFFTKGQPWEIIELRFSNLFCYGKNNIINFEDYDPDKIIGIIAKNHYGKSAILDVLLFCLFGKSSRGDINDIVNKRETSYYCSLLFSVGNKRYLVERDGIPKHNGRPNASGNLQMSHIYVKNDRVVKQNLTAPHQDDDVFEIRKNQGKKKLLGRGSDHKLDVQKIIIELVGEFDDFLATCVCVQNQESRKNNFMNMTSTRKNEYLIDVLNLDVFESLRKHVSDKKKILEREIKTAEVALNKIHGRLEPTNRSDNSTLTDKQIAEIAANISSMENEVNLLKKECLTIKNNPIIVPADSKPPELHKYNLTSEQHFNDLRDKLERCVNKNNDDYERDTKRLQKYTNKLNDLCDSADLESCNDKLVKYNDTSKNLNRQYVKDFPDIVPDDVIQKMKEERKLTRTELNSLQRDACKKYGKNSDLPSVILDLRERINKIKYSIVDVTDKTIEDIETERKLLAAKVQKIKKQLNTLKDDGVFISDAKKDILKNQVSVKDSFLEQCEHDISVLKRVDTRSDKSAKLLNSLIESKILWASEYSKEKKIINKQLSSNVNHEKIERLEDALATDSESIRKMDSELCSLRENLKHAESLRLLNEELAPLLRHEKLSDSLLSLDTDIEKINAQNKKARENASVLDKILRYDDKIADVTKTIHKFASINSNISKYTDKIAAVDAAKSDLAVLKKYNKTFLLKIRMEGERHHQQISLNNHNNRISMLNDKISSTQSDLADYVHFKKIYNNFLDMQTTHNIYYKILHPNCLPNMILQNYLPLVEKYINNFLVQCSDFKVAITYLKDKGNQKSQKITDQQLGIKLIRKKSSNAVETASGYERFIVNLAVRFAIREITHTSKPNFFIIDEGLGCFDKKNLNNFDRVLEYIKSQYDRVVIISHLKELQNRIEHPILIARDKKDETSFVNNTCDQSTVIPERIK